MLQSAVKKQSKNRVWTIHGLWPSRLTTPQNYPCDCSNESFNVSSISSLKSQLDEFWPSSSGENENFWKHEWEKHGTCAIRTFKNQFSYFSETLKLRHSFPADDLLKDYAPSPTGYSYDSIKNALKINGNEVILRCGNSNKKQRLQEIMICYKSSQANLDQFSCPQSVLESSTTATCDKNLPILIS